MAPQNDENCQPFDYIRLGNVELFFQPETIKIKCPVHISEDMVRTFALEKQ